MFFGFLKRRFLVVSRRKKYIFFFKLHFSLKSVFSCMQKENVHFFLCGTEKEKRTLQNLFSHVSVIFLFQGNFFVLNQMKRNVFKE